MHIFAAIFLSRAVLGDVMGTYYGQTLIRPFGYISPRPPAGAYQVDLGNIKIQFNARQVCGYTDWSTAVIGLPKQILSGKYWASVGENIKSKAISSILAISGALPRCLRARRAQRFVPSSTEPRHLRRRT